MRSAIEGLTGGAAAAADARPRLVALAMAAADAADAAWRRYVAEAAGRLDPRASLGAFEAYRRAVAGMREALRAVAGAGEGGVPAW
jgi:hypothetical protein